RGCRGEWRIVRSAALKTDAHHSASSLPCANPRIPTLFTVLFEDSAALLGLLAAALGVMAAHVWSIEWADAGASLVIAGILAAAAMLLAHETKGLLIGEAASKNVVAGIRQIIRGAPDILAVNELRTMHLAPHEILLALSVDFADGLSSQRVERSVSRLERQIKDRYPQVTRVFIGPRKIRCGPATKALMDPRPALPWCMGVPFNRANVVDPRQPLGTVTELASWAFEARRSSIRLKHPLEK
ncbi:MAG: hypothetical protein ACRD5Z_03495, partial [Bryobacteraceae bacterium]